MARKKTFQEKLEEHAHLRAVAHRVIDQMSRLELHRFFIRRKHFLEQPQIEVKEQAQ